MITRGLTIPRRWAVKYIPACQWEVEQCAEEGLQSQEAGQLNTYCLVSGSDAQEGLHSLEAGQLNIYWLANWSDAQEGLQSQEAGW